MISLSNFKEVLRLMGFSKNTNGNLYKKDFGAFSMAVDFDNKKLIYPAEVETNDNTTTNFSHNENFVVFECVNRLMEKGYRPKDVELEPKWRLGHESKSSGKPDILIRDKDGESLIIIECKTAGKEYRKEKKNTETNGGQLFSYWQQDNGIKWLALYASDLVENEISPQCEMINCTDDANILKMSQRDKSVKVFANAKNDNDKFETWRDTYNCQWIPDLLFNNDSLPYQIELRPLRKKDLRDFDMDDKIVNQFEEILRHNNVSDKENAFNRLVALFICKLVDEMKKQDFDEVEFQYKYTDDYETLQDRLQRLYKQGMEDFMKEDIFYVSNDYAERLFADYTGQKRNAAIKELNKTIRKLKFFTNNDFAFKDIHNEKLFYQNGKILVEVVQLFQPYRIIETKKPQVLGDLFERLLNKGFKQNEGQFFTPTPITRFIWDSLPLAQYITEHGLPRVLDYACGAGHFLTEAVAAVNTIRPHEDNSWMESHIYGVEKDYRLARVSKVSMFMNSAGGSNIIFGDGLENYPDKGIEPYSFDILVANPPYSVNGFKEHLNLHNNTFHILNYITSAGGEIETLFVERISQVLKPQGLAAVVLPSSILSNDSASYTAARGEILQNFKLRAIVAFGSKTFGATGTNTVTLFLEKYNEPPRKAEMVRDFVEAVMGGMVESDWKDKELFDAYIELQEISKETYEHFIERSLDWDELAADKYLKVYLDSFRAQKLSLPKNIKTAEEEEKYKRDKFYNKAIETEKQKLYYFALAYKQETLVVTAPSDNKEQKEFLGYDWSNRKGDEGIKIITPGGMLYNDGDRSARGTIACAIRNSFMGARTQLPEESEKYVKLYRLEDLINFSSASFEEAIATKAPNTLAISSKYPTIRLNDKSQFKINIGRRVLNSQLVENGIYPVYSANVKEPFGKINKLLLTDFSEDSIIWGIDGDWMVSFIYKNHPFYPTDHCGVIRVKGNKVLPYYVALALEKVGLKYGFSRTYRASTERIANVTIPLPPIDIQQKIVEECEAEDRVYNDAVNRLKEIDGIKKRIIENAIVANKRTTTIRLSDSNAFSIQIGRRVLKKDVVPDGEFEVYSANVYEPFGKTMNSVLDDFSLPSVIWGIDGDWMVNYIKEDYKFNPTDHCGVIRVLDDSDILPKYLAYALDEEGKRQGFSRTYRANTQVIKSLRLSVPTIETQQRIVNQTSAFDEEINSLKSRMAQCATNKQAILDKYLK